nr:GNAT family N-acetyltransferase [Rhizobium halophytocola]
MPLGYFDAAGRLVANFSAFALPLMVAGRHVRAAGFQSGAVRPEYRGRGLYRDLMRRAFSWADREGFEAGILLTDKPALYEPYGFRVMPQSGFRAAAPLYGQGTGRHRDLSLDDREDVLLIRRMLASRQPVSARFAVERQAEMFLLNASLDATIRLRLLEDCDAVVAWRMTEGRHLQLLDIVSPVVRTLDVLLAAFGLPMETVEVRFPPRSPRLARRVAGDDRRLCDDGQGTSGSGTGRTIDVVADGGILRRHGRRPCQSRSDLADDPDKRLTAAACAHNQVTAAAHTRLP